MNSQILYQLFDNRLRCTLHAYGIPPISIRFKWIFHTVNLLGAIHFVISYVGIVSTMTGPSMLPTLANSGELVVENRLPYRLNPAKVPQRGDLITLYSPLDRTRIVCKRVIGLPGDIICVDPTGQYAPSTEHVVVPKGHIWLMGDNAAYSRDSRTYGPVSMGLIRGSLYARVDPTIFIHFAPTDIRLRSGL